MSTSRKPRGRIKISQERMYDIVRSCPIRKSNAFG